MNIKEPDYTYKQLDQSQMNFILGVLLKRVEEDTIKKDIEKTKDIGIQIIKKRVDFLCKKYPGLEIKPSVIVFLSSFCESPGECVLSLVDMMVVRDKEKVDIIDLNFICEKVYPWGFYDKESSKKAYEYKRFTNKEYPHNYLW